MSFRHGIIRWTCDGCGATAETVQHGLPKGWRYTTKRMRDDGRSPVEHECGECQERRARLAGER